MLYATKQSKVTKNYLLLASNCLERPMSTTNHAFLLATPIYHTYPMPCAVMLDLKIGKGCQAPTSISRSMHTRHYSALLLTQGTMLGTLLLTGTMAHGVCALKSSSFITTFTHWETSSHMEKSTSSTVGRQYLRQHRLRI